MTLHLTVLLMQMYRYYDGKRGYTYPMLMAVITVDKGVVTRIDWDDNCNWCGGPSSKYCMSNTLSYEGELQRGGKNCAVLDSSLSCERKPKLEIANTTTALCELSVH